MTESKENLIEYYGVLNPGEIINDDMSYEELFYKTHGITYDDVVLHHTLPIFTGLGWCPIVSWDFAGAVSIFGPDALPVIYQ